MPHDPTRDPGADPRPLAKRLVGGLRLAALNLLGLALMALGLEAGTRALGLRFTRVPRADQVATGLWVYHDRLGWYHAPRSEGIRTIAGPDQGRIHINSLGLRGSREPVLPKPAGTFRILVVGDSFTFGVGVDEDHIFPARLEERLNRARDGRHYEVLNLGVSGYSTDQEYLLFQELAPRLQPDLVILMVCGNDFAENTIDVVNVRYYKPYFDLGPDGSLRLQGSPVPALGPAGRIKLWLGQHSNAWNLFRTRTSDRPAVQAFLNLFQVAVARPPAPLPEQVRLLVALVGAIRDSAAKLGAPLLVTNTAQHRDADHLFPLLPERLAAAGIPYLPLEGRLAQARRRRLGRRWEFPKDMHWNVDSHRCIGEILEAYVRTQFLRSQPAPPAPDDMGCGGLAG